MPSVTITHLYTFVALIAVSSLLVFTFVDYADAFKLSSEINQLKNLMNEVATKSTELVTLALNANSTAEAYVEMPVSVGNKQYWLKIENDSEKAWLNGGLGETISGSADLQVCLPREASAVGFYIGGRGAAVVSCDMSDGAPHVTLSCSGG